MTLWINFSFSVFPVNSDNVNAVMLSDENGAEISADNEENVEVTYSTYVRITMPGVYSVYGECDNAQILVDVDKETYVDGKVELELNGLTLSNSQNSPIYVRSIDKECVVTVKKGYCKYCFNSR